MEKIEIGTIQGYPVLYLPERDLVFCKNTVVPYQFLIDSFNSGIDRVEYKEKNLIMNFFSHEITLGCLTTNVEDFQKMIKTIKKIKRNEKQPSRCNLGH